MKTKFKVEYDNGDTATIELLEQTTCMLVCGKCKAFQVDVLKGESQMKLIAAVAEYDKHYEACPALSHEVGT